LEIKIRVVNPVTGIVVDPQMRADMVSIGGFQAGAKVMQYDGQTWTNLSGNLPNVRLIVSFTRKILPTGCI